MDVNSTPEPLEDVQPTSPAPADEQHPPGSSDEEDASDGEGGESNSSVNDKLATLDVDDGLDVGEESLPAPQTPHGVRPGDLSTCGTHRGTRKEAASAVVGYRLAHGDHEDAG